MIQILLIALLSVPVFGCSSPQSDLTVIKDIKQHKQTEHIEYIRMDVHSNERSIGYLHAVYANPKNVDMKIALNENRKAIKNTFPSALVVANAGFFTDTWKPTGLLRHSGRSLSPLITKGGAAGSGVFLMTKSKLQLVEREQVTRQQVQQASFAIQAGPRIIEPNGQPGIKSDDGKRRNRTLIGISESGRLVIASYIAHASGGRGLSLFQLQELLTKQLRAAKKGSQYTLTSALNLDGGPSSSFIWRGDQHKVEAAGDNRVLSVIALEAK